MKMVVGVVVLLVLFCMGGWGIEGEELGLRCVGVVGSYEGKTKDG